MPKYTLFLRSGLIAAIAVSVSGCMESGPTAMSILAPKADPQTKQLAQAKDDLDAMTGKRVGQSMPSLVSMPKEEKIEIKPIQGLGYAQVSTQPGGSLNQRRLLAIRAARLEAMRDLTGQVHGIKLTSESTIRDTIVTNDVIRGTVQGELRGARTLKINPKDNDTFEVILELDAGVVSYIVRQARGSL